jgi:cytidyltransferase-like protein
MNPLHCGHLDYFEEAWRLGRGVLLVIVNNDKQVKLKGSQPFMTEQERLRIVSRTKPVYGAILSIDKDLSVCETLRELAVALPNCPLMFCNSGDKNRKNIPEVAVCEELGIKMKFNVGGEKTQSSSVLLAKLKENKKWDWYFIKHMEGVTDILSFGIKITLKIARTNLSARRLFVRIAGSRSKDIAMVGYTP